MSQVSARPHYSAQRAAGRRRARPRRSTGIVYNGQVFYPVPAWGRPSPPHSHLPMLARLTAALLLFASSAVHALDITGAGSSAAQPLYAKLADASVKHGAAKLNYQPVGSAAGIRQIKQGSVDFGASDVALGAQELNQDQLVCFPTAISGVVPVVNLAGVKSGELQLSGELLASAIVVLARSDGSGTTYNFSDYLSRVSPAWKRDYGRNFSIAWAGQIVGAKGSGGMVAALKQTPGAIGYVDFSYVVRDKLAYARVRNADGQFVAPSALGFAAALDNSAWQSRGAYEEMLTDKPGAATWPITMGTFVIVPKVAARPDAMIATLKFFTWGFLYGDTIIGGMNFVRLPDRVQARIFSEFATIRDARGQSLNWSLSELINSPP